MIIRNKDLLATTPTRERALQIIEAGLEAIDTTKVIQQTVSLREKLLFIRDKAYDLEKFRKVVLVAFGKDAFVASKELKNILGDRLDDGVVLSLRKDKIPGLQTFECTHPDPSYNNVRATDEVIKLLKQTEDDDLILLVISGGGSAILTSPYKITVDEKALIARTLMNSGANIEELNIVRKHLSNIKGGRLAQLAYPSTLVTLIFSDVIGNDLSTIASGPTVMDHTSVDDAKKVIEKFRVFNKISIDNLEFTESPKDSRYFQKVDNYLIMDNSIATAAMEEKARSLGYSTRILANNIKGDAREVGKMLLSESRKGEALIAAGETTVDVLGDGVGGRNQELVLANLENIKDPLQVLVSVGSDGHDHSDFAGALGDVYTQKKANEVKASPKDYLEKNNSYNFFKKVEDGIETGLLESNVADIMLVVTDQPRV